MNEIFEALRKSEISIQGKKNPNRYLYLDEQNFLVFDYSDNNIGKLVISTKDLNVALSLLNDRNKNENN